MKYRTIDTKMKEIYINAVRIEDETPESKNLHKFWNSMNIVAMQNMSIQQIKYA